MDQKNRDLIHKQVCEKGFNKKAELRLRSSYGSKDAGCLVPEDRAGGLSADGRSKNRGDGRGD